MWRSRSNEEKNKNKEMKKYFLAGLIFASNFSYAQNKIDSLLGTAGIFSKLQAKTIEPASNLSFDLKLTVKTTNKKIVFKTDPVVVFINSKDGYIGIDKSAVVSSTPNANGEDFKFYVESLSKQSFVYSNNKKEGKQVEKMPSNLIMNYNDLPIQPVETSVATARKFLSNQVTGSPYFVNTSGMQKKLIRFLYGKKLPGKGKFKRYLGSFGVGFYQIDNETFLCAGTEDTQLKIEITKIEKVDIKLDARSFKEKK